MQEKSETQVTLIDINDILPNRFQPRIEFDEAEILGLSDSIKEHGIINPIIVRKIGNKYEIIAGERRYKAAVLAGLDKVPCIIKNLTDQDSAEVALLENVQRKNMSSIEEAISFQKILDMGNITQEQLADKFGKSQSYIANKVRLLKLSDEVQEALLKNKISERHARSLLRLDTREKQNNMLKRITTERLTVRKTDEEIDKMNNNFFNNTNDIAMQPQQPQTTSLDTIFGTELTKNSTTEQNTVAPIISNENNSFFSFGTPDKNIDQNNTGVSSMEDNLYKNIVGTTEAVSLANEVLNNSTTIAEPVVQEDFSSSSLQNMPLTTEQSSTPFESVISNVEETNIEPEMVGLQQSEVTPSIPLQNIPIIPIVEEESDEGTQFKIEPSISEASEIGVTPGIVENPIQTEITSIPNISVESMVPSMPEVNTEPEMKVPEQPVIASIPQQDILTTPIIDQEETNTINPAIPSIPEINAVPEMKVPEQPVIASIPQQDIPTTPIIDQEETNTINPAIPSIPEINAVPEMTVPEQPVIANIPQQDIPTTPIIENTPEIEVNEVDDTDEISNVEQVQPQESEIIPEPVISEPIIITDYNKQYDPIMPEKEPPMPKADFKTIIDLIRSCSTSIENSGYILETEEYDLEGMYQVVFKINK